MKINKSFKILIFGFIYFMLFVILSYVLLYVRCVVEGIAFSKDAARIFLPYSLRGGAGVAIFMMFILALRGPRLPPGGSVNN